MLKELVRLWQGELPFTEAFWKYVIVLGIFINISASFIALVVYVAINSTVAMVIIHSLPIPYNAVACIGAWRSAAVMESEPWVRDLAKTTVILTFLALLFL
jgi:hypothetical protein